VGLSIFSSTPTTSGRYGGPSAPKTIVVSKKKIKNTSTSKEIQLKEADMDDVEPHLLVQMTQQ
jgi:hypothetical protein